MCSYRRCQSSTVQARVPYSRRVLLHHRGSALMNIRNANAIFVAKKKKKFSSPAWALQRVVLRLPLYPTYLPGRRIEHGGRFCRRHITEKLFWVGRAGHPGQVVGKNDEGKSFLLWIYSVCTVLFYLIFEWTYFPVDRCQHRMLKYITVYVPCTFC